MNWFQINSKTASVPAEPEPGKGEKKEVGRRCDARQSVKRRKQWIIH